MASPPASLRPRRSGGPRRIPELALRRWSPCRVRLYALLRHSPHRLPDPFERREALAGDGLELLAQPLRVVGDQLGAVARPADLDIEALLGGQVMHPVRIACADWRDRADGCVSSAVSARNGRYAKRLASIAKTSVLVIDDWGVSKLGAENRHDPLGIIEDRHGSHSTTATSQLPATTRPIAPIGDPTLGDAILGRLVHNACQPNHTGFADAIGASRCRSSSARNAAGNVPRMPPPSMQRMRRFGACATSFAAGNGTASFSSPSNRRGPTDELGSAPDGPTRCRGSSPRRCRPLPRIVPYRFDFHSFDGLF